LEDTLARRELAAVDELVERLDEAMAPALAAARSLAAGAADVPKGESAAAPVVLDYSAVLPAISELKEQLQRRSFRARKSLEALQIQLENTPEAAGLHPVAAAVATLDFTRAAALLEKLTGQPTALKELA
jgi:hypothetical protein